LTFILKLLQVSDVDLDFDLDRERDLNTDLILTLTLVADVRMFEIKLIKINVAKAIYRILFYYTLDVRTAVLRVEQPSP